MKQKILNAILIMTSLMGYLEWGTDSRTFLFQAEWEVLMKLFSDPLSTAHPLTTIPLIGQLILLATLFQKEPSRLLTLVGLAAISLLLLFIFLIGLLAFNWKITLSTIPFIVISIFTIREAIKK